MFQNETYSCKAVHTTEALLNTVINYI